MESSFSRFGCVAGETEDDAAVGWDGGDGRFARLAFLRFETQRSR